MTDMTGHTPARAPRTTRAVVEALREQIDALTVERDDLQDTLDGLRSGLRSAQEDTAQQVAQVEDEHDRELTGIRRELARMVLACGVTLDDLAAAAAERQ